MTLLHQKNRHRDAQGRFIADYIDYAIVYQLLEESFAESLGAVKRYTDDRVQLIEQQGMITPRDLAIKTGVSTAAISQWSKALIEKGVLFWCDENGVRFEDVNELEKAKRTGKAHLCTTGGSSLPSPFELTGDPRWSEGGQLYAAYDLRLEDRGRAAAVTQNVISEQMGKGLGGETQDSREVGVKLLSEKVHTDELKRRDELEQDSTSSELDRFLGEDLVKEFSGVVEKEGFGSVNKKSMGASLGRCI